MNESESKKLVGVIEHEIGEWSVRDFGGSPYVQFWSKDSVQLDGDFSKRELEIIAKHMEEPCQ